MKWLQDNPLGMVLAGISGLFALLVSGYGHSLEPARFNRFCRS